MNPYEKKAREQKRSQPPGGGIQPEGPMVPRVVPGKKTVLGKALHVLGTGERFGTKVVLEPALKALNPEAYQRLQDANLGEHYGADIYRAVNPQAGTWDSMLAGMMLGGAVDPLTYLQVGQLTKLGKAARLGEAADQAVLRGVGTATVGGTGLGLAEKVSDQLRTGQRSLISLKAPLTESALPLVPPKVAAGLARVVERAQEGRLLHDYDFLNRVPGMEHIGAWVDDVGTRLGNTFGMGVGTNRRLWRLYKDFLSESMGSSRKQTEAIAEEWTPKMDALAMEVADHLGLPMAEVRTGLNRVLAEATEANSVIRLAKNAQGNLQTLKTPPRTAYDIALDVFREEFGLPASFGGPGSYFDLNIHRHIRERVSEMKAIYDATLREEERHLGTRLKLFARPEQDYHLHMLSQDAREILRRLVQERWGVKRFFGGGPKPSTFHPSMLHRRFRFVDQEAVDAYKAILEPVKVTKTKNLYEILKGFEALPPSRAMKELQKLYDKGLLTGEQVGEIIPPMSLNQANQWIWEKGIGKLVPPNTIREWFETDPTTLLASRVSRMNRAILGGNFFDAVKANPHLSVPLKDLPLHPDKAHWTEPAVPEMAGYLMNPKDQEWLNRVIKAENSFDLELSTFFRFWRDVTERWKGFTLALFPSYHVRNVLGNLWNYHLKTDNPVSASENMGLSLKAFEEMRKGRTFTFRDRTGQITYDAAKAYWEAAKMGAFGTGFLNPSDARSVARLVKDSEGIPARFVDRMLGSGVPQSHLDDPVVAAVRMFRRAKRPGWKGIAAPPPDIARDLMQNPFAKDHWYIRGSFKIGQNFEDRIRFAHIIQRLREGDTLENAVWSAKATFFDFTDLSPFERKVVRDMAFPFYAWSRKNIPFQLESMITHPARIARVNSAMIGGTGWETPKNQQMFGDWMKKSFPTRVRFNRKSGHHEYFVWKSWLPLADINDIVEPWTWMMYSLHPIPKAALEWVTNTNMMTRQKIDALNSLKSGERTKMFRKAMVPNKVANLLKGIRPINTMHQWMDNPQELDFWNHLLRFFVGARTYPLDDRQNMISFQKDWAQMQADNRKALNRAASKGASPEEIQRLVESIRNRQQGFLEDRGVTGVNPVQEQK